MAQQLKLQMLTDKLVDRAGAYYMEVSINISSAYNKTNGEQMEKVEAFKYFRSNLTKDGKCTTVIEIKITIASSAMAGLKRAWDSR